MSEKREFVAIGWLGILSIFASGFMLAEWIETVRESADSAPPFFIAIMFALIARGDAKQNLSNGTYWRRRLSWQRDDGRAQG